MTAGDGAGSWVPTRLRPQPGADATLEPSGTVHDEPEPEPAITVGIALPKGERGDWAVQKLTEVGVDVIVPLVAERSVARWAPDRADRARDRLERVVRAAGMQSRRARLPRLEDPVGVAELTSSRPGRICAADLGGGPASLERPVVMVGPEGGWAPGELAPDLPRVGLGPTVLRTETAAVVVGSALVMLRHFA